MDLERFKITVMPLREKMQLVAKNILANDTEAEDAVQETLLRLWNSRTKLGEHPNVHGFAVQTLKNICIDKIRTQRTQVQLEHAHIAEQSANPYQYTEQNNAVQIVRKIIDTLPELQRRIMLMRDVEGYELEEIAQIIGSEAVAVRVNLSRARKKVREKYINIQQAIQQEYDRD